MFHIYVINRQLILVSDMQYRVIGGRAIALPYKSYDFNVSQFFRFQSEQLTTQKCHQVFHLILYRNGPYARLELYDITQSNTTA